MSKKQKVSSIVPPITPIVPPMPKSTTSTSVVEETSTGPVKVDTQWLDELNKELDNIKTEPEVTASSIDSSDLPQPKRPVIVPPGFSSTKSHTNEISLGSESTESIASIKTVLTLKPDTVSMEVSDQDISNGVYISRATFIKKTGLSGNTVYNKLARENRNTNKLYPTLYTQKGNKSATYYKEEELRLFFEDEIKELKNKKQVSSDSDTSDEHNEVTQLVVKVPNTNGKSLRTLKYLADKFGINSDLMTSLALGVDSFPKFSGFSSVGEPLYDAEVISDYLKVNNIINEDNSLAICTLEAFGDKIHKSIIGSCKVKPVLVVEDTEEYFSKVDLVQWLLSSDPTMISRLF